MKTLLLFFVAAAAMAGFAGCHCWGPYYGHGYGHGYGGGYAPSQGYHYGGHGGYSPYCHY